MPSAAFDLARRLARDAEAVCRYYLPAGRREGRYWLIGDVEGVPGRSLYVRLHGPESGKGAAGKWTDAATGEHGDLLDLIAANQRLTTLRDTLDEARRFLSLPRPERRDNLATPAARGSPESRTTALVHLEAHSRDNRRGRIYAHAASRIYGDCTSLRFHPRCWYRPDRDDEPDVRTSWPALIAAVIDLSGTITGAHRTWLDPAGRDNAAVVTPRRAMGDLLGHGVRFGHADDVLAAGEGVETTLTPRQVATDPSVRGGALGSTSGRPGPAHHAPTALHRRGGRPGRTPRRGPARSKGGGTGHRRAAADGGYGRSKRASDAAWDGRSASTDPSAARGRKDVSRYLLDSEAGTRVRAA